MENQDEKYLKDLMKNSSQSKGGGFKVPANYFEELPYRVGEKKAVKRTKTFFWTWASTATGLVCVVLSLFLFDQGEVQTGYYSDNVELEGLNDEYLENEISEEDVIDFMIDEDEELNY